MQVTKDLEPITKQLTIVVGLTVVGFMAFGLAVSFYRNVLFEETLQTMTGENTKLLDSIAKAHDDLEYFRSAQYKDKYAKENLNKLNRGEKSVIITTDANGPGTDSVSLAPTQGQEAAYEEILQQMPVLQHWNIFIFHRSSIEKLKNGL